MKKISDYTIHCTEEQTKKALNLGAQIDTQEYIGGELPVDWFGEDNKCYKKPTAEQMIGFLEGRGDIKNIVIDKTDGWQYVIWENNGYGIFSDAKYHSRTEATLAAIDNALEYYKQEENYE